jgi:hypothetical protein
MYDLASRFDSYRLKFHFGLPRQEKS